MSEDDTKEIPDHVHWLTDRILGGPNAKPAYEASYDQDKAAGKVGKYKILYPDRSRPINRFSWCPYCGKGEWVKGTAFFYEGEDPDADRESGMWDEDLWVHRSWSCKRSHIWRFGQKWFCQPWRRLRYRLRARWADHHTQGAPQ